MADTRKIDRPRRVRAAVLPLIPAELGIHPLLAGTFFTPSFLRRSRSDVVNDSAADEALNYIATYLQRLEGPELHRIKEDMDCLATFARQEKWPTEEIEVLAGILGRIRRRRKLIEKCLWRHDPTCRHENGAHSHDYRHQSPMPSDAGGIFIVLLWLIITV